MESLVYTANQVAELFQISLTAVYDLRNKGKLKQLPNVSGVRFSKKEVEALAGVESEYSAIGYRKLKNEVERLEKENKKLKIERLANYFRVNKADLIENKYSDKEPYYNDPSVTEYAQAVKDNPNLKLLFDASKDMSKDDIDFVINTIEMLKKREGK